MNIFRCLLAAGLALVTFSPVRADFTMVESIEGPGRALEITTRCKENLTRVDVASALSIIVDSKKDETITLLHAQKKYMQVTRKPEAAPAPGPAGPAPAAAGGEAKAAPVSPFTPTGKKDTMLGFPVEEYTGTVGPLKLTLWLTKDVPDYKADLRQLAQVAGHGPIAPRGGNLDLESLPGFPLQRTVELGTGQALKQTVISLVTKPLPDSDFAVPAGYEETKGPTLPPTLKAPPALPPPGSMPPPGPGVMPFPAPMPPPGFLPSPAAAPSPRPVPSPASAPSAATSTPSPVPSAPH